MGLSAAELERPVIEVDARQIATKVQQLLPWAGAFEELDSNDHDQAADVDEDEDDC